MDLPDNRKEIAIIFSKKAGPDVGKLITSFSPEEYENIRSSQKDDPVKAMRDLIRSGAF